MYKVIKAFDDIQDMHDGWYHRYQIDDIYPHTGYEPTEDRIKELLGNDNLQRVPLIEAISQEKGRRKKV